MAKAVGYPITVKSDRLADLYNHLMEAIQKEFNPPNLPKSIRLQFVKDRIIPAKN